MTTCAIRCWFKAHAALTILLSGAFISVSCASAPNPTTPSQELPAEVLFLTLQANGEEMPGVEVQLVTRRGEVKRLGVTALDGSFRVSRERLRSEGRVVLFCMDWFVCSAVRVEEDALLSSGERLVTLSPAVLR